MNRVVLNVIVRKEENNEYILLLSFVSKDMYEKLNFLFLFLGALSYTAPEILESGQYTIQSDIYSFGCILLDMITCDQLTV
jgi:serine/threonine protein kinase